jgi:hypothetical protein
LGFLEKFIDLYENTINTLQRNERDLHVAIARLMEMLNLMISYLYSLFFSYYIKISYLAINTPRKFKTI